MLCTCSREQLQLEEVPQTPESLATRDFSVSGTSSRTGDWDSRFDNNQIDDVESSLKEALSLNYEEARALLGRLEYQRGNFDAALRVFQGIDVAGLKPRMSRAIAERSRPKKSRNRCDLPGNPMSLHSVSLLLEAFILKSKSLEGLGLFKEAATECEVVLDIVESAWSNGVPENIIADDNKLKDMFHKALELHPELYKQAGLIDEAISAYRRTLTKPWNLEPRRLAGIQKDLAVILLYGGVETPLPSHLQELWGSNTPKNNMEESILLLLILMRKIAFQEIVWDSEIINHLAFALSVSGQFEILADHYEQVLPGIYHREERWYLLALCYSAACQDDVAISLLRHTLNLSKTKQEVHLQSLLLGAKLCSSYLKYSCEGIEFARNAIRFASGRQDHFLGTANHFLGVCFGNHARSSVSDTQRLALQNDSLKFLHQAVEIGKENCEVMYNLGRENFRHRNVAAALKYAKLYFEMVAGSTVKGWKLLALAVSAGQNFRDAESIVDLALDQIEKADHLELLKLKALLQIAQEQANHAIETYKSLLTIVQEQRVRQRCEHESQIVDKNSEMEAWMNLAAIYGKLGLLLDANICLDNAKSSGYYSPNTWHVTGTLFEDQFSHKEALASFFTSLSIEPDYVPSMISTASIFRKLGGHSLPIGKSFLMNALRVEPMNHNAWLNLGLLLKMEGSLEQAADCFQVACELSESSTVQDFL
ncbi:hypothetical protein QJS04_geneDACA006265 [Acorus gramineus]|uniref:Uncharacterized protein n=1 Tax=Acorus gramineus TaxID=55184 RepID=A0AAV9AXR3_ACOGR|nr:hypothetical protein QJS04_geneDACA006265 [Acorus gramineus]